MAGNLPARPGNLNRPAVVFTNVQGRVNPALPMSRMIPMIAGPIRRWPLLLVALFSLAGCKQDIGERCEIDSDCSSGFCRTGASGMAVAGTCQSGPGDPEPVVDASGTMDTARPDVGQEDGGGTDDGGDASVDAGPGGDAAADRGGADLQPQDTGAAPDLAADGAADNLAGDGALEGPVGGG
jgi:hypothetical protein